MTCKLCYAYAYKGMFDVLRFIIILFKLNKKAI